VPYRWLELWLSTGESWGRRWELEPTQIWTAEGLPFVPERAASWREVSRRWEDNWRGFLPREDDQGGNPLLKVHPYI
jgi:predicted lipoprotein